MPDPISEDAEYVIIARRGIAGLFLSQWGRLQDPGAVSVICVRPVGSSHPMMRWLNLIRSVRMERHPGIVADAEVSPHQICDHDPTRSGGRERTREAA